MNLRKLVSVMALAASVVVPSLSLAADPRAEGACIVNQYRITSVNPFRVEERIGKASIPRLRGATLFVQAEPGLTAEWLELALERHVRAMPTTGMHDCVLDVKGVSVDVDSAGPGFRVTVQAKNGDEGEEVLRRARLLAAR